MAARLVTSLFLGLLITGCSASHPALQYLDDLDRQDEIRIGEENFSALLQLGGGEYTLDPQLASYVDAIGQRLARASGVGLPWQFTIINSSLPLAWSLPGGKVAISRGLLIELESEAELAAVLAHEIAHAANSHAARAIERGLLIDAALGDVATGSGDAEASVVSVGNLGLQLIAARFSRTAELEADRDGIRYMFEAGFDPTGAIRMQQRLGELGASDSAGLLGSHPDSNSRLQQARASIAALPAAEYAADRSAFLAASAGIRRSEAAYVNYNLAIWSLSQGDIDAAGRQLHDALAVENREARFHALLAEYHARREEFTLAIEEYELAARLEPEYHAIHQGRGLLLLQAGRLEAARESLLRANRLLENAETHEALGDIAVAMHQPNDAIGHYTRAARARSPAGRRAVDKLAALEAATD